MPLPADWVDSLFARLQVRYGSAWNRMWEGVEIAAVKADWAEELAGFRGRPEAIKHGLENLPIDRPPNVAQFRALCIATPNAYRHQALPAPSATPDDKDRVRKMLAGVRAKITRSAA